MCVYHGGFYEDTYHTFISFLLHFIYSAYGLYSLKTGKIKGRLLAWLLVGSVIEKKKTMYLYCFTEAVNVFWLVFLLYRKKCVPGTECKQKQFHAALTPRKIILFQEHEVARRLLHLIIMTLGLNQHYMLLTWCVPSAQTAPSRCIVSMWGVTIWWLCCYIYLNPL